MQEADRSRGRRTLAGAAVVGLAAVALGLRSRTGSRFQAVMAVALALS